MFLSICARAIKEELILFFTQIEDGAGQPGGVAEVHLDSRLVLPEHRPLLLLLRPLVVAVAVLRQGSIFGSFKKNVTFF